VSLDTAGAVVDMEAKQQGGGDGSVHAISQRLLPRFVRVTGGFTDKQSLDAARQELQDILGAQVWEVRWLQGFFSVPGHIGMQALSGNSRFFPMDASSGYVSACAPLSGSAGLRVLDLCCCPGAKLCSIADSIREPGGLVVGVDVSSRRIQVCKALLHRQFRHPRNPLVGPSPRLLLFHADGTKFCHEYAGELVFDTVSSIDHDSNDANRKRRNKSFKQREKKRLRLVEKQICNAPPTSLAENSSDEVALPLRDFDVVFVDAECSHDGSFRHMHECEKVANSTGSVFVKPGAQTRYSERSEDDICELQKSLLKQGYSLLRRGGTLLYSTCSLRQKQNEDVVRNFLSLEDTCSVISIPGVTESTLPCIGGFNISIDSFGSVVMCSELNTVCESSSTCDVNVDTNIDPLFSESRDYFVSSFFLNALLVMPDTQLLDVFTRPLLSSEVGLCVVSSAMSAFIACQASAPAFDSSLTGAVQFSRKGGTSGLFLVKLFKG
jgi:16S rRNA C967 or C1407 C5-methylase (RsmB/RsmF family)